MTSTRGDVTSRADPPQPFLSNCEALAVTRKRRVVRWVVAAAVVLIALGHFLFAGRARAADLDGRVVRVHDGDTLTVLVGRQQVRVRLVEIYAPELHQAFGRRSRDSLAGMCAGHEAHVVDEGHDRYHRTLGQVTCGSFEANAEQVRRGMAWVYVRYAAKNSPLYTLQSEARIERRGLWSEPHPVPPWQWRSEERARRL